MEPHPDLPPSQTRLATRVSPQQRLGQSADRAGSLTLDLVPLRTPPRFALWQRRRALVVVAVRVNATREHKPIHPEILSQIVPAHAAMPLTGIDHLPAALVNADV